MELQRRQEKYGEGDEKERVIAGRGERHTRVRGETGDASLMRPFT